MAEIIKKVASRLYFLRQLKRSKLASKDLIQFYITCIRPLTEYVCQVYHNSMLDYLSNDLERLQKRAQRIIFSDLSYAEALRETGLVTLWQRRQNITTKFFNEIVSNDDHRLYSFLPKENDCKYNLRSKRKFAVSKFLTRGCQNSFININSRFYSPQE